MTHSTPLRAKPTPALLYQRHLRRTVARTLALEGFIPATIEYPGWPEVEWPATVELDLHTQTCGAVSLWFLLPSRYTTTYRTRVGVHFGPGLEMDLDPAIPDRFAHYLSGLQEELQKELALIPTPAMRD